MLFIAGLEAGYGEHLALSGIDLSISSGEVCALLGPNGAGKSTLVSIVAGLREPRSGTVLVDGIDIVLDRHRAQTRLGIAPQDIGIYRILTVQQNLAMFCELTGVRRREAKARIASVAEELELTHLLNRQAQQLSGGEQRRVHTAIALVHRPPLLLLDEPTAGVDVATRSRLLAAIRRMAVEEGTAVCYTTHYLPEVTELEASVAIIDRGRIVARGELASLLDRHGAFGLEVVFDGSVPDALVGEDVEYIGDHTVRIRSDDAGTAMTQMLKAVGDSTERIRKIDFLRPDLDTVFTRLTGHHFDDLAAPAPSMNGESGSDESAS